MMNDPRWVIYGGALLAVLLVGVALGVAVPWIATVAGAIAAVIASALVLFFAAVHVFGGPIGRRQEAAFGAAGWAILCLVVIWSLWAAWQ